MLKKSSKRFVSIVLAIAMILTMIPFAAFADETTASDLDGHWAENVITEWMDYGVIKGYEDGTIRPNNSITRAEMTAMLDRVMDYQTKAANNFSDLQDTWYTDVILKANAAGVIGGYPDGTVKPDATITRQEAVAMFSRVLSLDTESAPEASFTDNADVADWAKDAVNAMAAKGYIHGSDGQFRPNDGITRAEVITIFNNIFAELYQAAGEYTGDVDGSAVVSADDVTLKDMTITGDLIIAEGVGDGHVVLDNVTVDGQLIVRGGGENSVIIKGDSKIDNISVERIDGAVRVAVEDNASVNTVLIDNGGQDVKLEGTIDTVNVAAANANVDITGAAKDINVADTAKNTTITLTSTATADKVSTSAENTTIIVAGTVSSIDIADSASNSVVTTQSSATVDKVTTAAGNTTIEGSGTVTDVVVSESASDATVTTEGTKVENNSSSNVTTGDDSVIAPGTTDTTPGGTTETPSVPSVPSGPSHTHNYVDGVCATDGAIDPSWAQVNSTATWNEAVAAGKNIVVTADFTTNAQLQITKAITVNGNGHTISAGTWTDANTSSKGDAHLVSINAGDNAVIIKNITLTGAKHIGDDYASGLNVYLSSNVTLDKVTLKDNDAAGMIVNGSNVKATGLVTSGNGWGGVNVDKGVGVEANTIFTFDATSTFAEASPVYSDNDGVTVNAPEGWAKAATPGEDNQNPNKCTWYKLFAGGEGTADNPYLISNAEQFNAIENLSNDMKAGTEYFFKQTADITGLTKGVNFLRGTYDGGEHKICAISGTYTGVIPLFQFTLGNSVIKNIDTYSTGTVGIALTYMACTGVSLTIDNCHAYVDAPDQTLRLNVGNFGFLISYSIYDAKASNDDEYNVALDSEKNMKQTITLSNCTINGNIENTGNCAAPFIGQGFFPKDGNGSKLVIKNCINNGNVNSSLSAGLLTGNLTYTKDANAMITAEMTTEDQKTAAFNEYYDINNVTNNGKIASISNTANYIAAATNSNDWVNQHLGTIITNTDTGIIGANTNALNDLSFNVFSGNGSYYIDNSEYTYKLGFKVNAIKISGGESNSRNVMIDLQPITDGQSDQKLLITGNVHAYDAKTAVDKSIITQDEADKLTYAYTCETHKVAIVEKENNTYLIFNNSTLTSVDSAVQTYVYGYDENGNLVGYKQISQSQNN